MTVAFLILSGLAAVGDWFAVSRRLIRAEAIAKPLTLVLLIVGACFADLGPSKPWVLAALVLCLFGDVALMFTDDLLPAEGDRRDLPFLVGVGSFALGHLAYVLAFARHGLHPIQLLAGALVVAGVAALGLPRILRGATEQGGRELTILLGGYAALLGAMVVLGSGTASMTVAVGAVLFLLSDLTLASGRFVQPLRRGPVIVAVTYHVAQFLIVIGLIR